MADFTKFSSLVHAKFTEMSKGELFVTNIDPDSVYALYLASFPEGTNPIFRERTEHDCSCCRNFIKNIGNVVSIIGDKLVSVWDVVGAEHPYAEVAAALASAVKAAPIKELFRSSEHSYGAATSKELRDDGTVHVWNHFHGAIASAHHTYDVGQIVGNYSTTVGVFKRGLEELTHAAFETVIDLIQSNSLYRGAEFLNSVKVFYNVSKDYQASDAKDLFLWANAYHPGARFRNTAIGTLVQDLSDGVDLEQAVKSFEQKVAPTNYKRPTALITPRMVQDAMATINEMGLESALERRFAKISDVSVNNVLWVDQSVAPMMKGGLEGLLMEAATPAATVIDYGKAEDISIDDFMANVVPQAKSMDIIVKNAQVGNFMSLTAPVHEAKNIFKWKNDFAWSYDGNITDSIKERVKAAGGQVTGDLCCRLAWEYTDDLDFYMREPTGHLIGFTNRRKLSPNGGMLDLDANGADGQREDPAENIYYTDRRKMRDGEYILSVHNYNRRSDGVGFTVEVEFDGETHLFNYDKVVRDDQRIEVARVTKKDGKFTIMNTLPGSTKAAKGQQKWGVQTETPIKVSTLMLSPNYWDDNAVGNKHWFFVLDGCKNDAPTRGIYNEFLSSDLDKHRKVFEVLGDKTKCQPTDDQLSGVGFSSTRGDTVLVSVTGAKLRKTYNITF